MWKLQPSTQFLKDRTWYDKKHPAELAAVLNNLQRFITLASAAPNSRAVQAGYLHTEGKGVLAVDERAGGPNLAATRLYFYADDKARILHLITIGNKDSQQSDVTYCHDFVAQHFPPA